MYAVVLFTAKLYRIRLILYSFFVERPIACPNAHIINGISGKICPVNPCGHVLRSTIINRKRGKTAWSDSISHYNRLSVFCCSYAFAPARSLRFFVILLMLFYGIRLDAKVLLRGYFCEIKIKVILLFGIIRIKLRYCLEYEPFNGITVFRLTTDS